MAQSAKSDFTIKPVVTVFTNMHQGLSDAAEDSGFDLDRAYLGTSFKYKDDFSGTVVLDFGTAGNSSSFNKVAYLKNAYLTYKSNDFQTSFGLVKTLNFSVQESFWGYRYVAKSYVDEESLASSADMGITASYKFSDAIKADVQIVNGEGYKLIASDDVDNKYAYGVGLTVTPIESLTMRLFYDINTVEEGEDKTLLSAFVGYKADSFKIGAEYNVCNNYKNVKDAEVSGFSIYSTVNLNEKFDIYARYDSTEGDGSTAAEAKEESRIWAGLQYNVNKLLKISPNIQYAKPEGGDNQTYIYLNVQFKL